MSDTNIDALISSIEETVRKNSLKAVKLRLSWWEPTLVFQKWIDKLSLLKDVLWQMDCKLGVAFLSNGTIIDEEQIDIINNNKIGLSISLDWVGAYNDNRIYVDGKSSFDKVRANIEKIIEKWLKPNILTVVSNKNLRWLPELTRFLVEKNLPFRYSFVQWEDLEEELLVDVMNQCYDILDSAIDNWYEFSQYHKLCDLKFLAPYFQTCSSGLNWGAIYLDGGFYFCHVQFWEDKCIWNIKENSDILELINKWKDNLSDLSEECIDCSYKYLCTWGCPIERVNGKDVHCGVYKKLIPRVYSLMGKERLLKILQMRKDG